MNTVATPIHTAASQNQGSTIAATARLLFGGRVKGLVLSGMIAGMSILTFPMLVTIPFIHAAALILQGRRALSLVSGAQEAVPSAPHAWLRVALLSAPLSLSAMSLLATLYIALLAAWSEVFGWVALALGIAGVFAAAVSWMVLAPLLAPAIVLVIRHDMPVAQATQATLAFWRRGQARLMGLVALQAVPVVATMFVTAVGFLVPTLSTLLMPFCMATVGMVMPTAITWTAVALDRDGLLATR